MGVDELFASLFGKGTAVDGAADAAAASPVADAAGAGAGAAAVAGGARKRRRPRQGVFSVSLAGEGSGCAIGVDLSHVLHDRTFVEGHARAVLEGDYDGTRRTPLPGQPHTHGALCARAEPPPPLLPLDALRARLALLLAPGECSNRARPRFATAAAPADATTPEGRRDCARGPGIARNQALQPIHGGLSVKKSGPQRQFCVCAVSLI